MRRAQVAPSSQLTERVVLLDEAGYAVGTAEKRHVHHASTPLHLAFSCYVFDARRQVLATQRALGKPTWPGVWTNSCCGHPAPGEDIVEAVRRRVLQEVGLRVSEVRLVLPAFRYRAMMADGLVENEMCPVFTATTHDVVRADGREVAAYEWMPWADFHAMVADGQRAISPWCAEQVPAIGQHPLALPERHRESLPHAARSRI